MALINGNELARGQQIDWNNPAGGYWDVGSNWDGGVAPGPANAAFFGINNIYHVFWDAVTGNTTTSGFLVEGGDLTLRGFAGPWTHTVNGPFQIMGGSTLRLGAPDDAMNLVANSELLLGGITGAGSLRVQAGSHLTTQAGLFGLTTASSGYASVEGAGAKWTSQGSLDLGIGPGWDGLPGGSGELFVDDGGQVESQSGMLGLGADSIGIVTVQGTGSVWQVSGDLAVAEGPDSSGLLTVSNGGLVAVGGFTRIGPDGTVQLIENGRFEFGTTDLASFGRILGTGGSLAGDVSLAGSNSLAGLTPFQNGVLGLADVRVANSGTLTGSAQLETGLNNLAGGELRTMAGERAGFGGTSNHNSGRVMNLGGTVEFTGQMTNEADGLVTGRGLYVASGGWSNHGTMAFSGTTDLVGDVDVSASGLIVISGNATTTFYDDVTNHGEIRTSGDGNSVFFGAVDGAGDFTGAGSVFFEGDLSPGNSPDVVYFGGNVTLGSTSNTLFELGGLGFGDFDKLVIAGNLDILGGMSVAMWNGFQLGDGMNFLVAEVGGTRTGMFTGLGEGALVGDFGGQDLFITYGGGDGNDIGLFTAIPEPGVAVPALFAISIAARLRRQKRRIQMENRQR